MSTKPSELNQEMTLINKYPSEDVMIIPQTKNAFMQIFGKENGEKALLQETTYFKELLAGDNGENIKKCSALSVQSALLTILGNGLSLSPIRKEATIIPRKKKNSDIMIATVSVMYGGAIKMMTDAKIISHIKCNEIVYDCDIFTCRNGIYNHEKVMKRPLGAVKEGVFLIAVLNNKQEKHIYVDADELAKRKAKSKTQYMWNDWEDQFWKKTAIHELFKYLPKNKATESIEQVLHDDIEDIENTYDVKLDSNTQSETIEPDIIEPKEIQDPMLLDTLNSLIAEHGSDLLSDAQIAKTREGMPTYSNDKLLKLIESMNKKILDKNEPDQKEVNNNDNPLF
jgi:hypothetical protein